MPEYTTETAYTERLLCIATEAVESLNQKPQLKLKLKWYLNQGPRQRMMTTKKMAGPGAEEDCAQ